MFRHATAGFDPPFCLFLQNEAVTKITPERIKQSDEDDDVSTDLISLIGRSVKRLKSVALKC